MCPRVSTPSSTSRHGSSSTTTFRNRFDPATRTAHLSEIFKWFDEDFKASAGSVQKYIARYVADPQIAQGLAADGYRIEWIDYDWNLNGTPPKG